MHVTRPAATALLLRRWLCAWLALLALVQMFASTLAGLPGAWHRHRPVAQSAHALTTVVVPGRHGEAAPASTHADVHALLHARGERHDHAALDSSVLPIGVDAASDAIAQIAAALAPPAEAMWQLPHDARDEHARVAHWVPTHRSIAPPLKPPRG